MDDVDGYPTVRGDRLNHDTVETWTVTLSPEGLQMEGPERTATVPLGVVYAVRQYPATAVGSREASLLELEWVTALGEDRKLALRTEDVQAVRRLCRIVEDSLREMDAESRRHRRFFDWPLAVLLMLGIAVAVEDVMGMPAPVTAYDWTVVLTQLVFGALAVPLLYVLARAVVRTWRSRRAAK